VRGEEKKVPKKKPTWAKERGKKKVNLSLSPWLTQGQGGTKKVHASVHHPSTLVQWWVLIHSGLKFLKEYPILGTGGYRYFQT
jgi:hypothetical protein